MVSVNVGTTVETAVNPYPPPPLTPPPPTPVLTPNYMPVFLPASTSCKADATFPLKQAACNGVPKWPSEASNLQPAFIRAVTAAQWSVNRIEIYIKYIYENKIVSHLS